MTAKYIIRYMPMGGNWHYVIYKKDWFAFSYFERWNKAETAKARLLELLEGNE